MMETKQSKPSVAMRVLEAVKNATPPGRYERGVWCFYCFVTDVADQYCVLSSFTFRLHRFLVKYPRGYLECGDDRAREKGAT
jgi:hypothetical protein